jgi:non-ribosomal peptide synthase protein (TIGR01720 family)
MTRELSVELAGLTQDQRQLLGRRLAEPTTPQRFPLSFTQRQLWFLDRMSPGTAVYNIPFALRLCGKLDIGALRRALDAVVARQEALRLVFGEDETGPYQLVKSAVDIPLPVTDLRHVPAGDRPAAADRVATEQGLVSFDLESGPLLAARLLVLADEEHQLLVTVHHIVYDAWSGDVFGTELTEYYGQFAAGIPADLPPLRASFVDYARRQHEPMARAALDAQLEYWREKLAGAPATSTPRPDKPRPAVQTHQGSRHNHPIPAELNTAMSALARESGVTFNAVALVAFAAALRTVTGQEDLLVGMPAAGRSRVELEPLIGSFANMLVLRLDLSGDPTVREAVRRMHQTVGEAYRHQDAPYARVVEELAPPRDPGINPIFQVLFTVAAAESGTTSVAGVEFAPVPVDNHLTDFDLFVTLSRWPDGCELVIDYNTDLYLAGTIARLAERTAAALDEMVRDPAVPLASLPSARRDTIAVAATFTPDLLVPPLRFLLDFRQCASSVGLVPYGQLVQHLLAGPDAAATVVLLRWEDWLRRAEPGAEPGSILDAATHDLEAGVRGYRARTTAPLVLVRCPSSPQASDPAWSGWFARLDDRLAQLQARIPGVQVEWAEEQPYPVGHDQTTDELAHIPYTPEYFAALATIVARHLPAAEPEPERVAYEAEHLSDPRTVAERAAPRAVSVGTAETAPTEPRTPTEKRLTAIWRDVLDVAEVGANSDFFRLGGHSLLATQLLSRIRQEFGRTVSIYQLLTNPTLAQMAAVLDEDTGEPTDDVLPPAPPATEPVASAIQQRFWAASQLDGSDAGRNTMFGMTLRGSLDLPALTRAVAEVVRRHEVLRTTFTERRGLPVPVVHESLPVWCPPVDLAHLPPARRAEVLTEYINRTAAHRYALPDGPLVRVQLLRAAPEEHHLLIGMHHIVCDAASWGLFLTELSVLYNAYTAAEPSPLPRPRVQYGDYAHHQRNWLSGAEIEADIAFWRETLYGAPVPVELPGDRPDSAGPGSEAGRVTRLLPEATGLAVRELARAEGVTPHSVVLAAFALLLRAETGLSDLVIGMPTSGRDRPDLQDVIGPFADLVPLRLDVSGRPSIRRLVRRLHTTVTQAQAHQRLPFPRSLRQAPGSEQHTLHCVLNYAELRDELPTLSELAVEPLPPVPASADFDIMLSLDWREGRLEADLMYSAGRFSPERADVLVARFGEWLTTVTAEPDTPVAEPDRDLVEPDRPVRAMGLASSFPTALVEPTLRFWSDLLGEPVLATPAVATRQVLRPLLDPAGPFRGGSVNVVLLRWQDWLSGEPELAAGVAVLERLLADLAEAVACYRARMDAELVMGICPASPPFTGGRWARILDGLTRRLAEFAAGQVGVSVLQMDRWATRYGVAEPCPGRDGVPYSAEFETAVATTIARWVRRLDHPPVPVLVLDPGRFDSPTGLVRVVRDQLDRGREVVLTVPPAYPELAALVAIGAVQVDGSHPHDSALLLSSATDPGPPAVVVPAGVELAAFAEHFWPLDAPATAETELRPVPAELLTEVATRLNTAERIAAAVRSGFHRSAGRPSTPLTERQRILAQIWAEVLHVPEVGPHDDFFELGGDSLLAITVAYQAAEAGIALNAPQLIEHRTIARLDLDVGPAATHEVVEGDVPLTPAQLWWFECVAPTMRNPSWFNHPYYLEVRRALPADLLAEAVRMLAAHHDSLRLRFRCGADGTFSQHHAEVDADSAVPFVSHDLTGLAAAEQDAAMASLAAEAQQALDITAGPTCRVLHMVTGDARPDRLLIVAHHLVVDAISRGVLLADLQALCAQLNRGEKPRLPAKTTSYGEWSERLAGRDVRSELPFWLAQEAPDDASLPADNPDEVARLGAEASISTDFTAAQTWGLFEVTRKLGATMRDLIVWALTEAVAARTGGRACALATTGHGREQLFDDVDLNRTTGWFQVLYPVLVRLPDPPGDAATAVTAVAEQLARVPSNGIGYGMLRFACPDLEIRRRLGAVRHPRIAINYMGTFGFDEVSQAEEMFDVCTAPYGDTDDGTGTWPYDLDVGGVVVGGRLRLDVNYHTNVYRARTAQAFLDDARSHLLGLLD